MANTYTLQAALQVGAAGGTLSAAVAKSVAPAGTHYSEAVQDFGTGAFTALTLGSIGTLGYLYIENLDAANYVQVTADGAGGAKIFARIHAGEALVVPCDAGASYGIKANTGTVSCRLILGEA